MGRDDISSMNMTRNIQRQSVPANRIEADDVTTESFR